MMTTQKHNLGSSKRKLSPYKKKRLYMDLQGTVGLSCSSSLSMELIRTPEAKDHEIMHFKHYWYLIFQLKEGI